MSHVQTRREMYQFHRRRKSSSTKLLHLSFVSVPSRVLIRFGRVRRMYCSTHELKIRWKRVVFFEVGASLTRALDGGELMQIMMDATSSVSLNILK